MREGAHKRRCLDITAISSVLIGILRRREILKLLMMQRPWRKADA
jgi:hypothetical protein